MVNYIIAICIGNFALNKLSIYLSVQRVNGSASGTNDNGEIIDAHSVDGVLELS